MTAKPNILLAIESAIRGGSIALFIGGNEAGRTSGNNEVSRAEDLLGNISGILARHDLAAADLDAVAVSTGPGSFTGIRIGIATVLGLRTGLKIDCFGVSVMAAMAFTLGTDEPAAAVIPIGKKEAAWQAFERGESISEPHSTDIGSAIAAAVEKCGSRIVFHEHIIEAFRDDIECRLGQISAANICQVPAAAIGKFALERSEARLSLEPFYLQNPRHQSLGVK